ncbi:MAG TPA: glycosyltransferase family 2 protein [Streptosporangiaceae bacterium]|nr:glycosyltransferase family 2 protein [Streptosporangiaceae bacterium]
MSLLEKMPAQSRPPATETLPVTVVVCAYTERRWDQTRNAVASVLGQSPRPKQMILVVDHNPELAARARGQLAGITVLENASTPGLSGARNTGLAAATQPVTAFLDDDAEARPGWLASLIEPYRDLKVVATGGSVYPRWPKVRPRWLPPTFDWVVGCSYLGLPETPSAVRNPIGANMSMRTELALNAGAFDVSVGRVGRRPRGCEETEMAIRLTASVPSSVVWYVPDAAVDHHVADDRLNFRYFVSRCWHEGTSKADVVRLAGAPAGLKSERRHTAVVIPKALGRDARALARGDLAAITRIGAITSGVAVTVFGYVAGRIRPSRSLA